MIAHLPSSRCETSSDRCAAAAMAVSAGVAAEGRDRGTQRFLTVAATQANTRLPPAGPTSVHADVTLRIH